MQRSFGIFCVSLIFCAALSETIGLVLAAKEKRGWTLNSAGYLLGPRRIDHLIQIKDSPSARGREELVAQYGIDGHRTLVDKAGLAGKRDMEEHSSCQPALCCSASTGAQRIADGDIIHTVIDFLSYLKLKEMGALDSLPSSLTSDELANP
ncbi:Galanin peptides-like [Dissostichus eleginoides]|uniref:Galanin peptides n=1 Tax=Dissostichus eleginoides TaxID=100907 RepID=A0AAD9CHL0_DISEL|nr:Galanin peptides-like [Dissostichus eleginoides]